MASSSRNEYDRRRNPPGWRVPRAPYNPFDPEDQRPAEGYPSEYNKPISKSWSVRAGENQDYRQFIDRMRMQAYPGSAPASDMYPGRFKVLRRLQGASDGFSKGTHMTSLILCGAVICYGTFFYRWNDGYSNIFSGPYRLQLRIKRMILGGLTQQQEEDLSKGVRVRLSRVIDSAEGGTPVMEDTKLALERPRRTHMIEVERTRQDLEEQALRQSVLSASDNVDMVIAASANNDNRKRWYKFW
ncbi:hypothetical protein V1512DRAFT_256394 [Lipomyces arxii]|uniref:uncharacterized protein n=1 Tax=Lipomyces arxii TaxID=56418 RepID=UPI0034CE711F